MIFKLKYTKDFLFFLFCVSVSSHCINYVVIEPFRLLDFFLLILLAFFILCYKKIKISNHFFFFLYLFLFLLIISTFVGSVKNINHNYKNVIFIYKYFIICFIPIFIFTLKPTSNQIKTIQYLLFFNFIFLVTWIYLYHILNFFEIIDGHFRPSFFMSNDYDISDAHLYSMYIGMHLLIYLLYWQYLFSISKILNYFIIIFTVPALFLVAARTGIVVFTIMFLLHAIFKFHYYKLIVVNTKNCQKIFEFFIFFSLFLIICHFLQLGSLLGPPVERALIFDLFNDVSSLRRVQHLLHAINEISFSYYMIGVGPISSIFRWYDGTLSILLAHSGISGVFTILFFLVYTIAYNYYHALKNFQLHKFRVFFIIILGFILSNIITEYFLVTRVFFSVVIVLSCLSYQILNKKKFPKKRTTNSYFLFHTYQGKKVSI